MNIAIRYEEFNQEFYADIEINNVDPKHTFVKHIASDNIKTLFDEIYEIAWNFRNNIPRNE